MPYIKKEAREFYHFEVKNLVEKLKTVDFVAGDINYIVSNIIAEAYKAKPSYQTINNMIGALEGAKLEFYRRVATPHEELKALENGDVEIYSNITKTLESEILMASPTQYTEYVGKGPKVKVKKAKK